MQNELELAKLEPKALIKATLLKFTKLFAVYDELIGLPQSEIAQKINSGDCGMAAIAVHHVLKEHYDVDTQIMVCRNHCWLHYDGVDYDTMHMSGYDGSAADYWEKEEGAPRYPMTFEEACEEWMPCDVKGAVIVKGFCTMFWVNPPAELQHCFDNADEYERPGELEKYEARMQSVLATL
jgi:hypothetical protein